MATILLSIVNLKYKRPQQWEFQIEPFLQSMRITTQHACARYVARTEAESNSQNTSDDQEQLYRSSDLVIVLMERSLHCIPQLVACSHMKVVIYSVNNVALTLRGM